MRPGKSENTNMQIKGKIDTEIIFLPLDQATIVQLLFYFSSSIAARHYLSYFSELHHSF